MNLIPQAMAQTEQAPAPSTESAAPSPVPAPAPDSAAPAPAPAAEAPATAAAPAAPKTAAPAPAPNGKIRRKELAETCATEAIEIGTGLESPFELAQDATTLFWTIDLPDGGIGTMDKAGTTAPKELVSGQPSPWGVDVDPATGAVYWTTSTPNGSVMVLVR